ncbi:TetR/AcrR family transcriptional regulator [Myceligenerans xiligouense]|uniref:TetR family transcriptional regulator n=1 Tax=Myceligenerans xiligouense TaxID=253184 RepID=A0A3N4YPH0_9MICO|nr:TetR/AcrR family transcriptional regulator [Myceligenerans xiligouense]RPF22513.1 TetR family transcriptional regulator [Myceligenerans xiligouense]
MAKVRTPRQRWIDEGWRLLASGGPEAVRVEPLAAALGVTKGGFYWQFGDRRAFLETLLDAWEKAVTDEVIGLVEQHGGDAGQRLTELFDVVSQRGGLQPLELAIRLWAREDPDVGARVHRVDERRLDYARELFGGITADPDQVEARSRVLLATYVAAPLLPPEPDPATMLRAHLALLLTP